VHRRQRGRNQKAADGLGVEANGKVKRLNRRNGAGGIIVVWRGCGKVNKQRGARRRNVAPQYQIGMDNSSDAGVKLNKR